MVQIFFEPQISTIKVIYEVELQTNENIEVSQFNVAATSENILITGAKSAGKTLYLELGGNEPTQNFGVIYTPGSSNQIKTSTGAFLGQIYYPINVSDNNVCVNDCDKGEELEVAPISVKHVLCLDENTIEVKFTRYISSNNVPPLSSFVLLDVPENAAGNFVQISISGYSVLIEHTFDFPLSGTSLQYLPPSSNYLTTTDTPAQLILPFIVPLTCGDDTGVTPCELNTTVHKNGVGTAYGTRVGELATIEDYILIYGLQEAQQASNDDNGGATTVNRARLQAELDNAAVMLNNYISVATWSGRALLAGSFKRTQLVITRYYLLNKSRPEVVRDEFERTLQWIEQTAYNNSNKPNPECIPQSLGTGGFEGSFDSFHSGGRVMSWGVTQQYRAEDGLGLRGWHLPTEGQDHLWKIQNGYYVPDYQKRRTIRGGA